MPKTTVLVVGLAAFALCLAAFVVMSVAHLDTSNLLTFIITVWGAVGGTAGVAAWRNTETIKQQTNGPLERTHNWVETTHDRVANVESQLDEVSARLTKVGV